MTVWDGKEGACTIAGGINHANTNKGEPQKKITAVCVNGMVYINFNDWVSLRSRNVCCEWVFDKPKTASSDLFGEMPLHLQET